MRTLKWSWYQRSGNDAFRERNVEAFRERNGEVVPTPNGGIAMKALTLSILIAGLATAPALSETMPKAAAPVTSADISSMFGGKTYTFKEKAHNGKTVNISWFLGTDGKMLGYTENGPSYAVGTWTASDGKLCVSNKWKGSWGESTSGDCQLWARDTKNPKKLYRAEITKGGDYTAYKPSLKVGDSISNEINSLKKKLK